MHSFIAASWIVLCFCLAAGGCRSRGGGEATVNEGEVTPVVAPVEAQFERLVTGPEGMVHRILAHPRDGRLIVTTDTHSLSLWNVVQKERLWTQEHSGIKADPLVIGTFNHEGSLFAIGGFFNRMLELRQTIDGEIAKVLQVPTGAHGSPNFSALKFSADDRFLLAADGKNGRIYVFNLETGAVVRELMGADPNTHTVGFNTSTDRIYAVAMPYLKIWNLTDEYWFKRISSKPLAGEFQSPLIHAAYLSENLQFAALVVGWVGSEKTLQIFDLSSEEMVVQFGGEAPIYQANFSDDMRYISFFEASGAWKTFRIATETLTRSYNHPDWQNGAIWYAGVPLPHSYDKDLARYFTPDGAVDGQYSIRLWSLGTLSP